MFNYDTAYAQPGYYWGQKPNRLAEQVLAIVPVSAQRGLRLVDLGCGEGRDLIYFARHGLQVTGVDLSEPGLAKARRWAAEEGLSVETVRSDIQRYRLSEPTDIVYASGTITYLAPDIRAAAFAHYRDMTRPGGLNAFNAFVEKPFIPTAPDWGADEHYFRSDELLRYYWDWEIVALDEEIFDCNSSGVPHRHAMMTMIAKKPV